MEKLGGKLAAVDIASRLANTLQVVFEVTDACNLKCKYCGFGEFYRNYDEREQRHLSLDLAKNFLQYLIHFWNSPLNTSCKKEINIGFYGGEPLLNVDFIKKIIRYLEGMSCRHNYFTYSMTTNGLLLHKHIDFLVKNDFKLLISLDGNEDHNGYRVFPDGTPAFKIILENARAVQDRYPNYFGKNVNFNAVLHNKNSVAELCDFFKCNFNKIPRIAEVNGDGIDPAKREEFLKTYRSIQADLEEGGGSLVTKDELFYNLPAGRRLVQCVHQYSGCVFKKYSDLIFSDENKKYVPTGTCLPFSRKIFLTVNGKILPCERIGHQYALGRVIGQKVELDFQEIADRYNHYYDLMCQQCQNCFQTQVCPKCFFTMNIGDYPPPCEGFMGDYAFSVFLSTCLSQLETRPDRYVGILEEVVVE